MPSWNPNQYLKFAEERNQPCRVLVRSIQLQNPLKIIDLGCGPGNSTQFLRGRWPDASILGLDSSEEMIIEARKNYPQGNWTLGDIADWKASEPYDLVFSNATLQWLPYHARILPQLLQQVKPGGAFAFQVPANIHEKSHQLMRDLAASRNWQHYFQQEIREWRVEKPEFYYDVLSPLAKRIDLWQTEYFHVLPDPKAIVEWYKGSGLRPFLDALPENRQENFLADYLQLIEKAFPRQANGNVLFPFLRLFVVAYRD
jgi:trans-aconitate 2-methyltransferase